MDGGHSPRDSLRHPIWICCWDTEFGYAEQIPEMQGNPSGAYKSGAAEAEMEQQQHVMNVCMMSSKHSIFQPSAREKNGIKCIDAKLEANGRKAWRICLRS